MLKFTFVLTVLIAHVALGNCAARFLLFTRNNPTNEFVATSSNINSSPFIRSAKTYFVVHGFNSEGKTNWALQIVKNLLQIENANVISVDWKSDASGLDYNNVAGRARNIGAELSDFINGASINRLTIHCIGHSLGAHVCGFAGKQGKLARISGLDPAGPLFKGTSSSNRLDKSDANLVDNIHGDAILGIQDNIGHKDFYPNGGTYQAGCFPIGRRKRQDLTSFLSCSHNRIPDFFAESIVSSCAFTSIKCQNYGKFI
jgi:hypothetical protein